MGDGFTWITEGNKPNSLKSYSSNSFSNASDITHVWRKYYLCMKHVLVRSFMVCTTWPSNMLKLLEVS